MGVMEEILQELRLLREEVKNASTDPKTEQKLISVKEAKEMLGVSKATIYELIKQDKIPHLMIGDRKLLPKRELIEWISKEANDTQDFEERMKVVG